jgi:hypothetical protein
MLQGWHHDNQRNNIKGNNTAYLILSITILCHYAERQILFIVMLNVIMQNVGMLSVAAP